MKKFGLLFIAILLILGFGLKYLLDRSMIFTGYAAKNLASGIFVAERTQEDLEATDLDFSLVGLAQSKVDYDNKVVYSEFYGFGKQKAIYREGLGVCLEEKNQYPNAYLDRQKIDEEPKGLDSLFFPKGNKVRDNIADYFDTQKLDKAIKNAFEKGNTRSVLIAYDTLAMVEKYAEGFNQDSKFLGWSASKSVAGALIGILVKEGKLDLDKPAPIAEWQNDERKNITLRHLLNMSSGLKWEEDYGDISEVTQMLYQKSNHAQFAIEQPLAYPPDSIWYYASGTSNILTEIIRRQFNDQRAYWQFPYQSLFHKISMYHTLLEADASGNFVGSSYTYATARDWARFGMLYLQNGIWFGDTILSPKWVDFTRQAAPKSEGKYGAQFWLNLSGHELPDAPKDIYFAEGFHGQRVYIIPSHRLVIVRTGLTTEKDFDYNRFVIEVINSLK